MTALNVMSYREYPQHAAGTLNDPGRQVM